jgi:hypothetical protein
MHTQSTSEYSRNRKSTATKSITGQVKDHKGIPIPGASVLEKGTKKGTDNRF